VEHVGIAAPAPAVHHPLVEVGDDPVLERGGDRLLDRDVDLLPPPGAPAGAEGEERADRGVQPGRWW
jgi:hypothetical protein